MKIYEPEENIFHSVVADITHRCNMECANCYIPNRNFPDMDKEKLYDLAKRLPDRTEIRLIGAEPTLHRDLAHIISTLKDMGHKPTIVTNGLRLRSLQYVQGLKASGLKSLAISMNGADEDSVYEITDNMKCADRKLSALNNSFDENLFVNVSCVVQKGVNDHSPQRLLELLKSKDKRSVIRVKNVGQIGRYSLTREENHTMNDLIRIASNATGLSEDEINSYKTVEDHKEENSRMFKVPNSKVWIKITDWSPPNTKHPDPNSTRRGRITEDFKIAPFFEHVAENENAY